MVSEPFQGPPAREALHGYLSNLNKIDKTPEEEYVKVSAKALDRLYDELFNAILELQELQFNEHSEIILNWVTSLSS